MESFKILILSFSICLLLVSCSGYLTALGDSADKENTHQAQLYSDYYNTFHQKGRMDTWSSRTSPQKTAFLSAFANAAGVVGIGFVFLQQISIAIGSPIFLIIFAIPVLCLGILLLFIPPLISYLVTEFTNTVGNVP